MGGQTLDIVTFSVGTMKAIIQPIVLIYAAGVASSFSAPTPKAVAPWQGLLDSLFQSGSNDGAAARRTKLKQQLAAECRENIGRNTPEIRGRIEAIIEELGPLNPTLETAASPLLKREWTLEWTSEKEINFFLDSGISDEITQTLDGGVLENYIPFVKGGGFGVTGNISVDEDREGLVRTQFKFENAKLDLGRWGEYNFPPVGAGWFDTIYLDNGE